jgi:hypothetical protein
MRSFGKKDGGETSRNGPRTVNPSRPTQPIPGLVCHPLWPSIPRAITSSDAKSHRGIHSSFTATRPRTRRILDRQGSTRRPSSTFEVSTLGPSLHCVTLWTFYLYAIVKVSCDPWATRKFVCTCVPLTQTFLPFVPFHLHSSSFHH